LDREVHIGKVEGPYTYQPSIAAGYPNLRKIRWIKSLPRTRFTQGALYEIGSALTLFQVKTYAEEFLSVLRGEIAEPAEIKDTTVGPVAEGIEESTRDFIIKQLAQELKGHPFAQFVAHVLELMGYRTRVSPEGPDLGVDIVAHKDELGFEPPIIKVQVKSTEGSVGDPIVSALYGKVGAQEFGLVVTLGTFSNQAKNFAQGKSNLRLIDGPALVELIFQHYEQFNARYKGLVPLKRVYVPEPLDENDEG
jgi:restriction system protein